MVPNFRVKFNDIICAWSGLLGYVLPRMLAHQAAKETTLNRDTKKQPTPTVVEEAALIKPLTS